MFKNCLSIAVVIGSIVCWGPFSEASSEKIAHLRGSGLTLCNVGTKVETDDHCGGGVGCSGINLDRWYAAICNHVNTDLLSANITCEEIPVLNCTGPFSHDITTGNCEWWVLNCVPQ